jgi:hypothetical protein
MARCHFSARLVRPSHLAACPSRTPLPSAPGSPPATGPGRRAAQRARDLLGAAWPYPRTTRPAGVRDQFRPGSISIPRSRNWSLTQPKAGRVVRTWRRNRPVRVWVQGPRRGARTREVDPPPPTSPLPYHPCWERAGAWRAWRRRAAASLGCGLPVCPVVGGRGRPRSGRPQAPLEVVEKFLKVVEKFLTRHRWTLAKSS